MKLCDFGLSRVKNKIDKKKNSGRVGTPHWMAPEILRQEAYTESSDVYSYGMILWYFFKIGSQSPDKSLIIIYQ